MRTREFPKFIRDHYEIHQWRHACAILRQDFPKEYADLIDVLTRFRLRKSHIEVGGKNKSEVAGWIDSELAAKGWVEKSFETSITVDQEVMDSPNALIAEGLQVMKHWGFCYKTNLVWYKIRKDGGPDGRGVGFYFRNLTELAENPGLM